MRKLFSGVMCEVQRIDYAPSKRLGRLYLPKDNSCDMNGAIKLFTNIDEQCRCIRVYECGTPIIVYIRRSDIGWVARAPQFHMDRE